GPAPNASTATTVARPTAPPTRTPRILPVLFDICGRESAHPKGATSPASGRFFAPTAAHVRRNRLNPRLSALKRNQEKPMALTQSQLADAVAERADLSRADAKRALAALEEVVLDEIGNAQKVKIGGLVQLTVRVKPATKERQGRNPATGEEITISAKPASVDVRARALAKTKSALPSLQKAKKELGG